MSRNVTVPRREPSIRSRVIARRQEESPPVLPCEARILRICTRDGSSIRNSASRGRWWMRAGSSPVKRDMAAMLFQQEVVQNSVSPAILAQRLNAERRLDQRLDADVVVVGLVRVGVFGAGATAPDARNRGTRCDHLVAHRLLLRFAGGAAGVSRTSALKTGRCNRPPVVTPEYATSASWSGSTHRVSCILTGLDSGEAARTCGSSARRIERAALRSQPVPTAPT